MGFNRIKKYFLIVIILMFFSTSLQAAEEDLDNLIALFDRPLEPLPITTPPLVVPIPVGGIGPSLEGVVPILGGVPIDQVLGGVSTNDTTYAPPFDDVLAFDKREDFSVFIPKHIKIASNLINRFLDAVDEKQLIFLASILRDNINPYLFSYAFSVALMHRRDTQSRRIPSQIQSFPYKYFDKQVFLPARAQVATVSPEDRMPIELERTASDSEDEHRLAYWREDIALNLHHWHWHLAYPNAGNIEVINKDRRGELFYYSHQQIIARYNFERLSNNLKQVDRLSNWYAPIKEAYFPKLDNIVAKDIYPSRPKNMIFDDIRIPTQDIEIDVGDMVRFRDRIFKAIDLGYAEGENGEKIFLDNITGINILGDIIESSELSPNPRYYGNLHGAGHLMIAYIHDPKHHHLQSIAVMGDTATAMRDPVFYRWHAYINEIFSEYKDTLPPYTFQELDFPGIQVASVKVKTVGEEFDNVFRTYWNKTDINLIHGLDFANKTGNVFVRYTHLNHRAFTYDITVQNYANEIQAGICRIYLAPAIDESRKRWTRFVDQKDAFIELDTFGVVLLPGINNFVRKSVDSSVTIPFEETFYDFDNKSNLNRNPQAYSGCGWPHHLLIPKGAEHGFPSQLFVIISSYDEDKVEGCCNSYTNAYCGVRGSKFPYKRPMGFPFDRLPATGVRTLDDFLMPNMKVQDCQIFHDDIGRY